MDSLIYDRTEQDVRTEAEKAYVTPDFLNRVEEWTSFLADRLKDYGYTAKVQLKSGTWVMGSRIYRSEMDRIRKNVDALQNGFCSLPDWREIVYNNTVDFKQMNALEWDLQTISVWLDRMAAIFYYSGEVFCGEV